jgi:hypothetical protein
MRKFCSLPMDYTELRLRRYKFSLPKKKRKKKVKAIPVTGREGP